jgi:hypothetical protein
LLQLCRYRGRLRRWIAAPTGFALALHLILSAAVIGHFAASKAGATGDLFVICHGAGDNSPADPGAPPELPDDQSHCVLCTLAHDTCAVIPVVTATAALYESTFLHGVALRASHIVQFASLASEYPRGPPTHAHFG